MTPVLTSCVTMTPPSDSAATDSGHSLGQGSVWSGFWSISKSVAKSFHPDFDPGQRTDPPDSPWIQLKIQPKELALRLAQKAIPADSYFNTINQVAMACLALASLPGCGGETPQDHYPGTSKEPPGTSAPTSASTSSETPTSMRSNSQGESVVTSSSSASAMSESTGLTTSSMLSSAQFSSPISTNSQLTRMSSLSRSSPQSASSLASTAMLTTESTVVPTKAFSDQATTEPLSSHLGTPLNSTATPIAIGTSDYLSYPSSAKTSFPVSPSSSNEESTLTSSSPINSELTHSAKPSTSQSSSQLVSPMASSPASTISELASSATLTPVLSSSHQESVGTSSSASVMSESTGLTTSLSMLSSAQSASPTSTISQLTRMSSPSLSSPQSASSLTSTVSQSASTAMPPSAPSSSQLASSPALSPTLTTSESSSSAVLPSTFPTSQPTSPTTVPPGCRGEKIPVQSNDDLAKIGNEPCYPPDGKYEQTVDIDAGNHSPIQHFTGEYNGNGKSISNLNNCLFQQVENGGIVRDVVVEKADVVLNDREFKGNKGVIACEASGHALLKNNTVEHSDFKLVEGGWGMNIGMLAGEIRDNSKLEGNQVKHSTMSAVKMTRRPIIHASVGILTGKARGFASLDNNSIDNCTIMASHSNRDSYSETYTGLMAGRMENKVTVKNSKLTNNQLTDTTRHVHAGGVAGWARGTTIEGTYAFNNTILSQRSSNQDPKIAVVVASAKECRISNTTVINNTLKLNGYSGTDDGPATGIVTARCKQSTIQHTLAEHSELYSRGPAAVATAYLHHECTIHNTTARNVTIKAWNKYYSESAAAIAVAEFGEYAHSNNMISQTTAIDCRISAVHEKDGYSYAAVGTGYGDESGNVRIIDTTACNTTIKGAHAGIAAGQKARSSTRTRACNTIVNEQPKNPDCPKANCLRKATGAPPTRLTTATTTGSNKTTTDFFNPSSETQVKSTATTATMRSPDYPNYSSSAKSSLPVSLTSPQLESTLTSSSQTISGSASSATSATPTSALPNSQLESALTSSTAPSIAALTRYARPSLSSSQLASPPASSSVNKTDNGNTSSLLLNTDEVDAGIPVPSLAGGVAAGILTGGIILYASYQWYQGYRQGLRGKELALRPITCISDAICCHPPAMGKKADSMELVSLRPIDV
ncbi:hypothetical protein J7438_17520 [Thalassotalea sp. G20_0]|uniref:hypothetical protein n=1 Tax=Thalassotalea sp. G20_0 TaxID=2821093 RepID=UPI001ADAC308|nr:hypothetical protein [Thalassotalea sp. G20_0]MBO9495866.1 hypothetical protein [Thalassotalea sp. G20_0]